MRKLKTAASGKVTGCPCKNSEVLCGEKRTCRTTNKPCKNISNSQLCYSISLEASHYFMDGVCDTEKKHSKVR